MTEDELAAIEARANSVRGSAWTWDGVTIYADNPDGSVPLWVADVIDRATGVFIAAAPVRTLALVAEVRRLQDALRLVHAALSIDAGVSFKIGPAACDALMTGTAAVVRLSEQSIILERKAGVNAEDWVELVRYMRLDKPVSP